MARRKVISVRDADGAHWLSARDPYTGEWEITRDGEPWASRRSYREAAEYIRVRVKRVGVERQIREGKLSGLTRVNPRANVMLPVQPPGSPYSGQVRLNPAKVRKLTKI